MRMTFFSKNKYGITKLVPTLLSCLVKSFIAIGGKLNPLIIYKYFFIFNIFDLLKF